MTDRNYEPVPVAAVQAMARNGVAYSRGEVRNLALEVLDQRDKLTIAPAYAGSKPFTVTDMLDRVVQLGINMGQVDKIIVDPFVLARLTQNNLLDIGPFGEARLLNALVQVAHGVGRLYPMSVTQLCDRNGQQLVEMVTAELA